MVCLCAADRLNINIPETLNLLGKYDFSVVFHNQEFLPFALQQALLLKPTHEGDSVLPSTTSHPQGKHVVILGAILTHKCLFLKVLGIESGKEGVTQA